ncbi:hypothetical protein RvY_11452-1 [Ramazzottius varieornatus]|uniref:Uncharacterized protein n=1 Tax=Ramazzottius varieornatus TaxID=947166 RepID=A0A1D1VQ00_RAMVA|nr:hypothetical protein RvY_11452-1 [Ramazzottius varieornatus]
MSMSLSQEELDYGEDEDDGIDNDVEMAAELSQSSAVAAETSIVCVDDEEMPTKDSDEPKDTHQAELFTYSVVSPERDKHRPETDWPQLPSRWTSPSTSTAGDSGIESVASSVHPDTEHRKAESLIIRQTSGSPEIQPPAPLKESDVTELRGKKCYLAYHQYPTYPKIKTDYSFLRKRNAPANRHQLLHLCHDGTDAELLIYLEELVGDVFHYKKAVIFARRRERLMDIRWGLKKHCKLDCLLIDSGYEVPKIFKICDYFAEFKRRILLCHTHILPSKKALKDTDLVIWWHVPRTVEDFMEIKSRLTVPKALILVILKQENDWQFLDAMEKMENRPESGLVFPEFCLNSTDEVYAGFMNSRLSYNREKEAEALAVVDEE